LCVSADLISRVTDAVLEEISDWHNRALEPMYPIVILDVLRIKIRDAESRQVKNKAVYMALGVSSEGEQEILGVWIASKEGAKFWLSIMNNLRNRGVEDILIAVLDGLKGFAVADKHRLPGDHGPDLHRASGAPFPELLRLERSQSRSQKPEANLLGHG